MSSRWRLLPAAMMLVAAACGRQDESARSQLGAAGRRDFTVLTYNVQSRPVLDRQRAQRNLPRIGELLRAYDFVGVQECFANCRLLLDAADHPTKAYFSQRKRWWSVANSGLAVLGRLPLVELRTEFYEASAEVPDRLASKGIILTRFELDGVILDIYDTHMQAGHSAAAARARRQEAEQLVRFVARNSPPEHAVVVMGDFNMGPHRQDRPWHAYTPRHYASEADMQSRTAAFSGMMQALQLTDASDSLFGPRYDHIDRVLFRSPAEASLAPVSWQDLDEDFRGGDGKRLSDGSPIAVRFSLTRL